MQVCPKQQLFTPEPHVPHVMTQWPPCPQNGRAPQQSLSCAQVLGMGHVPPQPSLMHP